MFDWLHSFFSLRFLKFCVVGASGVVVNLLFLALFSDVLTLHLNLASALAIEMSINSNFFINEAWTFSDRHLSSGRMRRWAKFHLVSLVGGAIQWIVFIACNLILYKVIVESGNDSGVFDNGDSLETVGLFERYVVRPITHPPDVGGWKYLSQLFGIGAATFWNYIANFYWTWARGKEVKDG